MNKMKMTFVNVGYGEAILVECPDPARRDGTFVMLTDGGSGSESEYADRSSGRIPLAEYLDKRNLSHIDILVNTHVHEDHVSGLVSIAAGYAPEEFWQLLPEDFYSEHMRPLDLGKAKTSSQTLFMTALNDYVKICTELSGKQVRLRTVAAPLSACVAPGLKIDILAPGRDRLDFLEQALLDIYTCKEETAVLEKLSALDANMNNLSIMMLLDYRGTRILLPGDINCAGYAYLEGADLKADIFKVGHHGQADGINDEQLVRINPAAVVCCASSDNKYNSAHPELMNRIRQTGAKLCFSDCPSVPGETIPPHSELVFEIGEGGDFTVSMEL